MLVINNFDDLQIYCDWLEDQGIDAAVMRNLLVFPIYYDYGHGIILNSALYRCGNGYAAGYTYGDGWWWAFNYYYQGYMT